VSRACDMHGVEERCIQDFGGKMCLEDLVIDWKISLKWLLKTYDGMTWTGLIWPRQGKILRGGLSTIHFKCPPWNSGFPFR